jgi:MFS family permease
VDLRLSHTEFGLLMSLFALPGVFLLIPAGRLVDRYGARVLTLLGLAGMIADSLLVAVGQDWSILTFGPGYFIARGCGVGVASFLASFLMLPSPLLAPGVGYLVDRLGREELLLGLGGLLVAGSILAIAAASLPLAAPLVLLGVGVALVPPPIFALPSKLVPPQRVGTGYGIVSTCLNVGVVAGLYVSGAARDLTGTYRLSFYLVAGFALLAALLAVALARARQAHATAGRQGPLVPHDDPG